MSRDEKNKTGAKKTASKLGHDPLAWINDSDVGSDVSPGNIPEDNDVDRVPPNVVYENPSINMVAPVVPEVAVSAAKPTGGKLSLPAIFGIAQSSDICGEMRKIFASGCKSVDIAGDDVESFDAAALQLMVAFNKQALDAGMTVNWIGRSQKITEVAALLNVKI